MEEEEGEGVCRGGGYDEKHGHEGPREGPEVDRVVRPEEIHAHDRICEPRRGEDRPPRVCEVSALLSLSICDIF